MSALAALAIVALTVIGMEIVATLVHRHVMHGFGWAWHESHHTPRAAGPEKNDLFAIVFAALSIALFVGGAWWPPLKWIGVGTVVYGVLYAILHDGIVHRRLSIRPKRLPGYVAHLVEAHHLHHAVNEREGCVSYGFLFARPTHVLRAQLRRRNGKRAEVRMSRAGS